MSYASEARGLRALARLVVLPLLGVGVGLGAAYAVTAEMTPTYRATASVVVLPKEKKRASASDLTDVSLALNVSPSVARLAESREVADTVAKRLRRPEAEVFGKVTAVSEPGNQIVTVQAEADSPVVAAKIVNEITKATTGVYDQLQLSGKSGVTVQALDIAAPPVKPVSPRPLLNYALGALVGLLVGVGIATLRSRADERFRGVRELEKRLGLPTLAMMRSLPRWPPNAAKLYRRRRVRAAVDAAVASISVLTGDHRHCRVLVTSVGADRPTPKVAALLTQGLARHGHRAVVVDAQLRRRGVDRLIGAEFAVPVASVLDPANDGVAGRMITYAELNAHLDGRPDPDRVAALIEPLAAHTDALVITAPPVFSGRDLATLAERVDVVLLVVDSDRVDRPEATRAALLVRRLGVTLAGTLVLGTAVERDGAQPVAWRTQVEPGRRPRQARAARTEPLAGNGFDTVVSPDAVAPEPEPESILEPTPDRVVAVPALVTAVSTRRRLFAKPSGRHAADPSSLRVTNGARSNGIHGSETGTVTPLNGSAADGDDPGPGDLYDDLHDDDLHDDDLHDDDLHDDDLHDDDLHDDEPGRRSLPADASEPDDDATPISPGSPRRVRARAS